MERSGHLNSVVIVVCLYVAIAYGADYSMYVWTDGYDPDVTGCDSQTFLQWDETSNCFTHTWNTSEKRQWLWDTCNVQGREVSAIYLSDIHQRLKQAYDGSICATDGVSVLKQTAKEGHATVSGLTIYGLYAVSDIDVTEKDMVKYIVYYNDNCAASADERLDGVAVNNEAYAGIKCSDVSSRQTYLDNLQTITTEAAKQQTGTLLTHYSVGWHWGICNDTQDMITWNGTTADANHHMIDIFDSVDVQVGYTIFDAISDRMVTAGYDYAQSLGKKIYVTLYTNKADPCQITFFPATCATGDHTESGMFNIIDQFSDKGIGYAKPCIHYFRGVYSSGGNSSWPSHLSDSSNDDDDDENCSNSRIHVHQLLVIVLCFTVLSIMCTGLNTKV